MDPDRPFRTRLISDARQRSQELGPVNAILVSGDIAFKAHTEEYAAAYKWLCELAAACGCQLERVYVIPGNHDVDHETARTDVAVVNVHRSIANASAETREAELLSQFSHSTTGTLYSNPSSDITSSRHCSAVRYTQPKSFSGIKIFPSIRKPFCFVVLDSDKPEDDELAEAMLFNLINSKALSIASEHSLSVLMRDEGAAMERWSDSLKIHRSI